MTENTNNSQAPDLRSAWQVKTPGYPPLTMAGERCTRADALRDARVIWPDAEILNDDPMPNIRLQVADNAALSEPE